MQLKSSVVANPSRVILQPPLPRKFLDRPWAPIELKLGARGEETVKVRFHLRSPGFVFRVGSRRLLTAWRRPVELGTDWRYIGKKLILEIDPAGSLPPASVTIEIELEEVGRPSNRRSRSTRLQVVKPS